MLASFAVASVCHAAAVLYTDFSGRTVNGKTAEDIPWQTSGFENPGWLTAVDEAPTNPAFTSLFNTPNSQGYFAPDKNLDNEGPWSVQIPLVLSPGFESVTVDDVVIDWRHFNNTGGFQTTSKSTIWTATVTGSISGTS